MREQSRGSGYELTGWVNRDYGVLVSPGTIYLRLYSLERQGLIRGVQQGRRREFAITNIERACRREVPMLEKPKEEKE